MRVANNFDQATGEDAPHPARSATKGKTIPRQGCHKCKAKPAPGMPYLGSPCEKCRYHESMLLGHGRGVSFDAMEMMIGGADNGRIVFNGEEIVPEDAPPEMELFAVAAPDGRRTVCPHLDNFIATFGGLLREFSYMDTMVLAAIFGTLRGRRLADIAAECGCTFQNISIRLHRAMESSPTLRVLLPAFALRKKGPKKTNPKVKP